MKSSTSSAALLVAITLLAVTDQCTGQVGDLHQFQGTVRGFPCLFCRSSPNGGGADACAEGSVNETTDCRVGEQCFMEVIRSESGDVQIERGCRAPCRSLTGACSDLFSPGTCTLCCSERINGSCNAWRYGEGVGGAALTASDVLLTLTGLAAIFTALHCISA
ncbi:uncharacterized protein LOC118415034 [Branchiostoma floridae]|uniref:Uncharacterized protein LOC118415034 n=1 Tax=Branchiostoma floridae TaxID=7739 RepID=A0A9J7MQ54_BRAFL|nr:uncharacterized protein LOC118415034 [Branchiostoma floridae]